MSRFRLVLLAAALAAAGAASAQKVYRYVYPDGRIVYSDTPVPGAKLQGEVAPPPPPSVRPGAGGDGAAKAPAEDPVTARLRARSQADDEVRQAEQGLAEARARLEAGKEPLPGERTGTAGGGSRLNEAYEARQQQNEKALAEAQARLDRALAARSSVR